MTVIVHANGILAADLMVSNERSSFSMDKIEPFADGFLASHGNLMYCMRAIEWYKKGAARQAPPLLSEDTELIVASAALGIRRYSWHTNMWVSHGHYAVAFGSGKDFAYGALAHGANAIEAVRAAMKYSPNCGHGVQAYDLTTKERINT